jgi:hypothetical protein
MGKSWEAVDFNGRLAWMVSEGGVSYISEVPPSEIPPEEHAAKVAAFKAKERKSRKERAERVGAKMASIRAKFSGGYGV